MRVIARDGVHEIEIQRSRFLCSAARVADEAEAVAFIAGVRKEHWSANHNCTAFRVDGTQRSNDDGEPSGTAGVPMLEVLIRRELTDTAVVVTRYFGGIKLGAGGLVRAYGRAVSETVDALGVRDRAAFATFTITVDHTDAGRLQNALHSAGHLIADVGYTNQVTLTVHIPEADAPTFHDWLATQSNGTATALQGPPVTLDV
ncbi:YigZ family protein [Umezawaea tangerina]|uniref:Putative YigZ family protein n=1 Tax=Umezawaea tangerina TaxID=84725 RepID=A0A2T0T4M0_9PSEU|nr:YigZ family protein [Umezawaea tangerina]PRY40612.1 putative YigZ family protein [Umezawaea tangerina]